MTRLSILLIEEQISTAAEVAQVLCHELLDYRLAIVKSVAEAVAAPEPADVILLNSSLLTEDPPGTVSALTRSYPNSFIMLLQVASTEECLLSALAAGADDYIPLSEAGLVVLGRRLANLAMAAKPVVAAGGTNARPDRSLASLLAHDQSPLPLQIIGPDNRLLAWNQAMATFSGLSPETVGGTLIDELPISPGNLSRLKDILDQARVSGEPFAVSDYPLEDLQGRIRWGRLYVYPLPHRPPPEEQAQLFDVCILSVNVSDIKEQAVESWKHAQELRLLLEISREVSEQLDLKSTLAKIAEQTKSLLNAATCQIYFLEKDNQTLRPVLSIGPEAEQIQNIPLTVGQRLLGSAMATGRAVLLNAATGDSQPIDSFVKDKNLMGAPLTALRGIIGLVVISRNESQPPFQANELNFFGNLVRQASLAINNARLFAETQRNLNELAIFYEASATISTTWDTQQVLNTLIRQMVQGMEVSQGYIVNWNKNLRQGAVQAIFFNDERSIEYHQMRLGHTFNLTERPAIATIINQQRPVFFQLSSASLHEIERQDMEQNNCLSRLLVPLVVKSETIGWAELWEVRQERIFTADEIRLVRMLANQAAVTLENARYLEQTQQTLEETTALYEVARALANTQDSQTVMSTVLQEYLRVLNLYQGSVIVFDFETKMGVVKVNIRDEQAAILTTHPTDVQPDDQRDLEGQQITLRNNPLYARLMRNRQPVVINDPEAAWLTPLDKSARSDIGGGWASSGALSMLVIPIQIRGEISGAVVVEATRQRRRFEQWTISLGQAMADQLSIALENVRLYELEYERRRQAETLREVSFAVGSSRNLNEVLERILDQLGRVIKYDSAAIHLIEGKQRRIIAGRGFPQPEKVIGLTFPITLDMQEPGSVAIHTRQPLCIGDIQALYSIFREDAHNHIHSWMGIPLVARDKVIGLISIDRTEINAYNEGDVNLAQAFANQVAITLENARLYELEVRQLERELEIARGIQRTLLPQIVPKIPGLEICGRVLPAHQIGGDFFHFFFLGQDHFGLAIGDVSGKGIPAALYMAVAMTAIDAQISDTLGPGELLNKLQSVLFNRLHENKMNVGLQVATFTTPSANGRPKDGPAEKVMTLASAGMIAPILATAQGCQFLTVSGLPIGTPMIDLAYNESQIPLPPFTAIIFTSDGIVEARNEAGQLFGFERLEKTINEIIDTQQAEIIADYVIQTAQKFTGTAEQNDDMTVVVVIAKN